MFGTAEIKLHQSLASPLGITRHRKAGNLQVPALELSSVRGEYRCLLAAAQIPAEGTLDTDAYQLYPAVIDNSEGYQDTYQQVP